MISASTEKISANLPKIFAYNLFFSFLVVIPVIVPFWQQYGLSLKEIYQLQAIFGAGLILLDVPAGYLSDLLGRKNILMAAGFFNGVAYVILNFGKTFWQFAIFEIFVAVALALYSGCDVALLYDSLDTLDADKKSNRSSFVAKRFFFAQMGETIASFLGGILAMYSLNLPAQANAITAWIPFFIACFFVDPPRTKMTTQSHWGNIKFIFKNLFGHSRLLSLLVVFNVMYGFATYVTVWVYQPYWEKAGVPLIYFGYLWAGFNLTLALISRNAPQIERKISSSVTVVIIGLCPIIAYIGLGFFNGLLGIPFILLFSLCRGLNSVILQDAINARVPAVMRATTTSMCSLGMRAIFFFFGPLVGQMFDEKGFKEGFYYLAIFYSLLFLLLTIPILRLKREFRPLQ